jgi:Domain of unknown function (DUF4214)
MLISLSKRFIFIANMKTASTAIESALRWTSDIAIVESHFGKHQLFSEIAARFAWLFDIIDIHKFFKFGVIRDPNEYVVSLYNSHMHPRFRNDPQLYTRDLDFDRFLTEWIPRNPDQATQQHVRFLDEDGRIAANYLISYDKLESGLRFVADLIDAPHLTTLGRENVSPGSFRASSLSEQQRAWIETHFGGDLEMLANDCDRLLVPWSRRDPADAKRAADEPAFVNACLSDVAKTCGPESIATEEDVIRGCYRTFLLREPDPPGLYEYAERLRGGDSIEQIISTFLRSTEFAEKQETFLQDLASSYRSGR